jgi:hypothetical protein
LAVIVAWTGGRPAASLAFERGAGAVALDVHLEDGGVMNQAVDDRDRHAWSRAWQRCNPHGHRLGRCFDADWGE